MKITKITKIENNSLRYDIQTTSENFFANNILVHNSMLTPVPINGDIFWKTKKSFFSDVAIEATKNITPNINDFARYCAAQCYTPIFEYTSPSCEIVLDYGTDPQFVLLAMRSTIDGSYLDYNHMVIQSEPFGITVIKSYEISFVDIVDQMKTVEDFEGYVLRFDKFGMTQLVKIKSEWYLRMHRVKTALRERDVADMFLDETIDDVKSAITAAGLSLEPIEAIERRVTAELSAAMSTVAQLLVKAKKMKTRKDVAIEYNQSPLFGLLMSAYSGNDPDYKKYWVKNYRDGYGLNTIYSNFKGDVDG